MMRTACLVLLFGLGALAHSDEPRIDTTLTPEARGRAIAEEAQRRDQGYGDTDVELTMSLLSADGRERTRRLSRRTLEVNTPDEGDKSLTLFHEPRDIAGTAFLSFTHIGRPDDQWLYLPSLKRVKRIAAVNLSSAFVGSEFDYEDLLSDEVEKFDYLWLADGDCEQDQCHVIERRPRYADSGYSRQVLWIDRQEFRPMKIAYYDRKDRHVKTLILAEYRQYPGNYWRAHRLQMTNHLTQKSTALEFSEYRFRTGLGDRDFDPSALRRLR